MSSAAKYPYGQSPRKIPLLGLTGTISQDSTYQRFYATETLVLVPEVFSFIDQPADWHLRSSAILVRGWCFAGGGRSIVALRLFGSDRVLPGTLGLPRPDVSTALPNAPHDHTGFEIRGVLPVGRYRVRLEAELDDGTRTTLLAREVRVPRRAPAWLSRDRTAELVAFQMAAHAKHAPKPLEAERYPRIRQSVARPPFAIVTPSFQQGRFLATTLDSVLEQRGVTCQYVVQDGGSTDGSGAILSQRASRLAAIEIGPDGGQADAIVRGFGRTSGAPGDLMAWINSDDFYLPGALAFVADYFARHPAVDALYGHRIVVDEESREIGRWFLPRHDSAILRLNDFVPQETLFWRRRIWDHVGGLDPSFQFAMDWDLLLRFQAAGANIVRVPYFLACFRVHSAQKTSAQMHSTGQAEIDHLRIRTFGRALSPAEIEEDPRLHRYLRRSALIESLWSMGIRAR